jgi:serine/threonine-protein kinase RsbW
MKTKPTKEKKKKTAIYTIELASTRKEVVRVEQFLNGIKKRAKLNDEQFYRLFIAATEAVTNAIVHGNNCDIRKTVLLKARISTRKIVIEVYDQGKGFNPYNVPNPLDDKNLLKENGRGVFLMKELMDIVEFKSDKKGSKTSMTLRK